MRAADERSLGGPDGQCELAAVLDLLPLASMVLDADSSALAVNEEWALLCAAPVRTSRGESWLDAVEPADRAPLRRLLRGAVAAGKPGSADVRLTGSGGGRPSRWWWRPCAPGQLVVCVADLDRAGAPAGAPGTAAGNSLDVVTALVHRMFGIGLVLESAAGLADGPVSERLQRAIRELDAVIRDVRTVVFTPPAGFGLPDPRPGDDWIGG